MRQNVNHGGLFGDDYEYDEERNYDYDEEENYDDYEGGENDDLFEIER